MIIAVDGPTASGKGTIAAALAAHFGLAFLDTGLLYRAVGRQVLLDGGDPDDSSDALAAASFPEALLADPHLRSEETGGFASRVSSPSSLATITAQLASPSTFTLVRAMSRMRSNTNNTAIASTGKPTAARIIAIATSEAEGIPATPIEVTSAITTIENWTVRLNSSP